MVNGVAQPGGQEIDVTPANVANTVLDAGTAGGTDTLWGAAARGQWHCHELAAVYRDVPDADPDRPQ
jgi:hypothetical protein